MSFIQEIIQNNNAYNRLLIRAKEHLNYGNELTEKIQKFSNLHFTQDLHFPSSRSRFTAEQMKQHLLSPTLFIETTKKLFHISAKAATQYWNAVYTMPCIEEKLSLLQNLRTEIMLSLKEIENRESTFLVTQDQEYFQKEVKILDRTTLAQRYLKLLVEECRLLSDLLELIDPSQPQTQLQKSIQEAHFNCLNLIIEITQDPLLKNQQTVSFMQEKGKDWISSINVLLGAIQYLILQESKLEALEITKNRPRLELQFQKQKEEEISQLKLLISQTKFFLNSKRISFVNRIFEQIIETKKLQLKTINITQIHAFDTNENETLQTLEDLYQSFFKELKEEDDRLATIKKQHHTKYGNSKISKSKNLVFFTHRKQEDFLIELIEKNESTLLTPLDYTWINTKEIFLRDFPSTMKELKSQIRELKQNIEEATLDLNKKPLNKGNIIKEFLNQETEIKKSQAIVNMEKDLKLLKLGSESIQIDRLLHVLGVLKNGIKKRNKEIEANKKIIEKNLSLTSLCEKIIALNEAPIQEFDLTKQVTAIRKTFSSEINADLTQRIKDFPDCKGIEVIKKIKENVIKETKVLEFSNEIKTKEITNDESKSLQLNHVYRKMIQHYESLFFSQNSLSLKDACLEKVKEFINFIFPHEFVDRNFPHPREFHTKWYYASLGYSMNEEVERLLNKLMVNPAKGETWQTVLLAEIQKFLKWAEKRPYTAASMAGNTMQVGAIIMSTISDNSAVSSWIKQFTTVLKAKIYTHVICNAGGYSDYEPLDEEEDLYFRALSDLLVYAPATVAALKGAGAAFSAQSLGGAIIKGISGAVLHGGASSLIRKGVDQIATANTEVYMRAFRLIYNVLRNDPYVDSVVEQRNVEFTRFLSTLMRPGTIKKAIRHWWKSVKHAQGKDEKWLRIGLQLGIPVLGTGTVAASAFLMSPGGAFLASYLFGSTIGIGSFFGVTGFVAFSIYLSAYRLGQFLNDKYSETQEKVRQEEGQELCRRHKGKIVKHVEKTIEEFRRHALIPPRYTQDINHRLIGTTPYFKVINTLYPQLFFNLNRNLEIKKQLMNAAKEHITMKDCVKIFAGSPAEEFTLVETIRKSVEEELRRELNEIHHQDAVSPQEELTPCINKITFYLIERLEKDWLQPVITKAYEEQFTRLYVASFSGSIALNGGTRATPDDILKQELNVKIKEQQNLSENVIQDFLDSVNQAIITIRKACASNPP